MSLQLYQATADHMQNAAAEMPQVFVVANVDINKPLKFLPVISCSAKPSQLLQAANATTEHNAAASSHPPPVAACMPSSPHDGHQMIHRFYTSNFAASQGRLTRTRSASPRPCTSAGHHRLCRSHSATTQAPFTVETNQNVNDLRLHLQMMSQHSSTELSGCAGIQEAGACDVVQSTAAQASIARQMLLQDLEDQRVLQRRKLLHRHLLRWKLHYLALNAQSSLAAYMRHAQAAQLLKAGQESHQVQQKAEGWQREHGEAAAVSTAVTQRLRQVHNLLVPTAIEQQQQVRRLLQDRHRDIASQLKAMWDDYRARQRLRRLANYSEITATGTAGPAGLIGIPAALAVRTADDPLAQGVRAAVHELKLPSWMVGFRPGFNPDADQFWLERQWQSPPFSTALAAALERRLLRQGASWWGGPKTQDGLLMMEELQLQHMLREQKKLWSKMRLREWLSQLPCMGYLRLVPLAQCLGTHGGQSAWGAAAAGKVLPVDAAAAVLESNIKCLLRLWQVNQAGKVLTATVRQQRTEVGCRSADRAPTDAVEQLQRTRSVKVMCHGHSASARVVGKQRLWPWQLLELKRQRKAEMLHVLLPVMEQVQTAEQLQQDRQSLMASQPATTWTLNTRTGNPPSAEYCSSRTVTAMTQPVHASVDDSGEQNRPEFLPVHAAALRAAAAAANARVQNGHLEDSEATQGVTVCSVLEMQRCGLWEAAQRVWDDQHARDIQKLQQFSSLAEPFLSLDSYVEESAEEGMLPTAIESAVLSDSQTLQHQQQPYQVTEENRRRWCTCMRLPKRRARSEAQLRSQAKHAFKSPSKHGAGWLDKYAARIGRNRVEVTVRRHVITQKLRLLAVKELFAGPPIWQDAAAAAPLTASENEVAAAHWQHYRTNK